MRPKLFLQIIVSFVTAGILISVAAVFDRSHSYASREAHYRDIARQWMTQLETIALDAHEVGRSEPLRWSVERFNSGTPGRRAQFFLIPRPQEVAKDEAYSWNGEEFDYAKAVTAFPNLLVRIRFQTPKHVFFGAAEKWEGDLRVAILLFMIFATVLSVQQRRKLPPPPPTPLQKPEDIIASYKLEIRPSIKNVESSFRNLSERILRLTQAAKKLVHDVPTGKDSQKEFHQALTQTSNELQKTLDTVKKLDRVA